jgi:hypothetical protein
MISNKSAPSGAVGDYTMLIKAWEENYYYYFPFPTRRFWSYQSPHEFPHFPSKALMGFEWFAPH